MKNDKQQRQLSVITRYVVDVCFIKGQHNIVADCLSRPVQAVTVDVFDLPALAEQQAMDEEIEAHKGKLATYTISPDLNIWCDKATPYPRPYVPVACRAAIFDSLHSISHPGVKGTLRLIKQRYYYPNMDKDIRIRTRNCQACQKSKVQKHTKSAVQTFHLPSERFENIHIDIIGPLPVAKNLTDNFISPFRYVLTCVDRATKWLEAMPIEDITAATVATAFVTTWVSHFGVLLHVITDRGTQFESELFKEIAALVGFHRLRTTSFHAQANGMIERQHRTLKSAIMARNENWLKALPIVLLGMRIVPTETGYSPFSAVTGASIMFPRPLLGDSGISSQFNSSQIKALAIEMSKIDFTAHANLKHHNKINEYLPPELLTCSHVWVRIDRVRKLLEAPYSGPFKVIDRKSKYFLIETLAGKIESVSIDRLKPVHEAVSPDSHENLTLEDVLIDSSKYNGTIDKLADAHETTTCPTANDVVTDFRVKSSRGRHIKFKKDNDYFYY